MDRKRRPFASPLNKYYRSIQGFEHFLHPGPQKVVKNPKIWKGKLRFPLPGIEEDSLPAFRKHPCPDERLVF